MGLVLIVDIAVGIVHIPLEIPLTSSGGLGGRGARAIKTLSAMPSIRNRRQDIIVPAVLFLAGIFLGIVESPLIFFASLVSGLALSAGAWPHARERAAPGSARVAWPHTLTRVGVTFAEAWRSGLVILFDLDSNHDGRFDSYRLDRLGSLIGFVGKLHGLPLTYTKQNIKAHKNVAP